MGNTGIRYGKIPDPEIKELNFSITNLKKENKGYLIFYKAKEKYKKIAEKLVAEIKNGYILQNLIFEKLNSLKIDSCLCYHRLSIILSNIKWYSDKKLIKSTNERIFNLYEHFIKLIHKEEKNKKLLIYKKTLVKNNLYTNIYINYWDKENKEVSFEDSRKKK